MRLFRRGFLFFLLACSGSVSRADWRNDFHETLFPVDKDGKWGFIDAMGKVVIPFQFDEAREFHEGLASVKVGDKYGFIDERGEVVIAPRYSFTWGFSEGLAYVVDERGPSGFIDRTGKIAFGLPASHSFMQFHDGLALGRPIVIENGIPFYNPVTKKRFFPAPPPCGWIDKTGGWAIKPAFDEAWWFSDGLACVCPHWDKATNSGKWGFIDTSGTMVIPPRFDGLSFFDEGLASVEENGRHFFINKTGERAFAGDYEECVRFSDGLCPVRIKSKWGFIDHTGKFVIEPKSEEWASFSEGRAGYKAQGKWGFIDKNGTVVVPPIYDYVGVFGGGLAQVGFTPEAPNGAGRGYINRDGKIIWAPRPKAQTPTQ